MFLFTGYTMKVTEVNESNMRMLQDVPFEGRKVTIAYDFVKNN